MKSLILSTAARQLLPLLLLFALFMLMRGHNFPGGGFVGGLVAAAAFTLYTIAFDVRRAREALGVSPQFLIALGLLTASGSGILSLLRGHPFMTGLWSHGDLPVLGHVGTPMMFDTGVLLVVVGVTLLIIFTLAED